MSGNCNHDHARTRQPRAPASPAGGRYRTASVAAARPGTKGGASCCQPGPAALGHLPPAETTPDGVRTAIRVLQMDCPTEEALIRKKLAGVPAVKRLEFNLVQRSLSVVHAPGVLDAVLDAIRSLGFSPELPDSAAQTSAAPVAPSWRPLALAALAAAGAEAAGWVGLPSFVVAGLALAAVLVSGLGTYRKGWVALRHRNLNINALMSIAVTGALLLGQWPEAAMVMVLFTLAERIEARSLDRAREAVASLMALAPDKALVRQADGEWRETEARAVVVGSLVRVKPGERIALDGRLVSGRSTVNQAPITGESLPVDKQPGDVVFAGTINDAGSFEYLTTASARHSTLARIIDAVEAAQGSKAPTQRFVDRFAQVYTPIVFALAVAVAVLPPLFAGGGWLDWVYKALVLLVIACPCALVISTPVTIVSGLAAAAHHGILVKGGAHLEAGRKLAWLALDKTGTLTHGKPRLRVVEPWSGAAAESARGLAASLAARSDHPVSRAIAQAAAESGIATDEVAHFAALPGRGVRGDIAGRRYWLGNHRLIEELGRCSGTLEARLGALERQGNTVVALIDEEAVLALFVVADTIRDSSRAAIAELHRLGVKTMILSGDNPHTVEAIAREAGIDRALGNQLPEDKLAAIRGLEDEGAVGMVGDGINDAPALARARIGFAMGAAGSDAAIETADVALMDDDLRKIPFFIRLSGAVHTALVQNIALALGIKLVFLALTLAGLGAMWMAVFADVGASLLVVGNGLRLLRRR